MADLVIRHERFVGCLNSDFGVPQRWATLGSGERLLVWSGQGCVLQSAGVDIHMALISVPLEAGDPNWACQEAERAQQMNVQMGYHWGQVDAAEVLGAVGLNH